MIERTFEPIRADEKSTTARRFIGPVATETGKKIAQLYVNTEGVFVGDGYAPVDRGAYAKLRILYDPQEVISNDNWYPPEAAEAVTAVNDGACQGKFVCNKMPDVDENGCAVINGTRVCESSFKNKSPASGISPLCQEVSVDAQCNFYKGDMQCYTDAQGNEQCPTNSDKTCAVSHDMRVVEVPVSARFAVEDAPGAGETNRVEVDFLAGTYRNTSSNLRSDGYVDQASLEVMCKKGADGKRLPQRFAVSSTSIWTGHKFAPNTLTEDSLNIVQMPTCDNGLKMIVDVKDTGKGTPGAFYAHELKLKNVRIDGESFGPQYCIDSANKIQNGQCSEGGSVTVTRRRCLGEHAAGKAESPEGPTRSPAGGSGRADGRVHAGRSGGRSRRPLPAGRQHAVEGSLREPKAAGD